MRHICIWGVITTLLVSCNAAQEFSENDLKWKKYIFTVLNITVLAPDKIKYSQSSYDGPQAYLQMYPSKRPASVVSDTLYKINIKIRRSNASELEEKKKNYQRSGLFKRNLESQKEFWLWNFNVHQKFDCRNEGDYCFCRKDIVLGREDLISVRAEILKKNWPSNVEFEMAKKEVEIIMNSIEVE